MVTVILPSRTLEITFDKAVRLISLALNCRPSLAEARLRRGDLIRIAESIVVLSP